MFTEKKKTTTDFIYFEILLVLRSGISTQINYFNNIHVFKGEAGGFPNLKPVAEKIHLFSRHSAYANVVVRPGELQLWKDGSCIMILTETEVSASWCIWDRCKNKAEEFY